MDKDLADKQEKIVSYLQQINEDLSRFISEIIESGPDEFKHYDWSNLEKSFPPVHCWEVLDCKSTECGAYGEEGRCWLMAGTLCDGTCQGPFHHKYRSCVECTVFEQAHQSPERGLFENINILISHLQLKAHRLHQSSIRDGLTGLYNRRHFEDVVTREAEHHRRRDAPLSLLLIDVNSFKELNDNHGHLKGDYALKEIAKLVSYTIRSSDIAFRFGGDEFLVLLMDADGQQRHVTASRIHTSVEQWNQQNPDFGWVLGLSIGGATCECVSDSDGEGFDIDKLISQADHNMYAQKKSGKFRDTLNDSVPEQSA